MAVEDLERIRKALEGDAEATGSLLEAYRDRAYAWALGVLRNATQAEEVVGKATLKALETIGTLRDPEAFSTWLYRLVFRMSLNAKRDRGTERRALSDLRPAEAAPADEETALDPERIREAMKGLPLDQQIVLTMRYWRGMSFGEIAEELGVPEGTVKVRAFRAHRRLKETLELP